MKEYEDKMRSQQKRIEELNTNGAGGGKSPNIGVSNSGDEGLVD